MKTFFSKIWHLVSSRYLAGGFVIASLLLVACDENLAFSEYKSIPKEGWGMRDTLDFTIDSLESKGDYVLVLGVRTSSAKAYTFKDVQMQVEQTWEASVKEGRQDSSQCVMPFDTVVDTIKYKLVDDKGESLGVGISNYQYLHTLDTLSLPVGAKGKVRVLHRMRKPNLTGIVNVGVELRYLDK